MAWDGWNCRAADLTLRTLLKLYFVDCVSNTERSNGMRHWHVSWSCPEIKLSGWFCEFREWDLHALVFTRVWSESAWRTDQWPQTVFYSCNTEVSWGRCCSPVSVSTVQLVHQSLPPGIVFCHNNLNFLRYKIFNAVRCAVWAGNGVGLYGCGHWHKLEMPRVIITCWSRRV
jgi:hypothetical protein